MMVLIFSGVCLSCETKQEAVIGLKKVNTRTLVESVFLMSVKFLRQIGWRIVIKVGTGSSITAQLLILQLVGLFCGTL